ncbi:MAG: 3-hydroxy-3-methylglutaryl-CoA reductase, partial [Anaerolineae bacterium]|nr:3-hydroxy-3-methylglutaryl-CoA reductase [Anaerolineae bacterium]
MSSTSQLSGFYNLPVAERLERIARQADLTTEETQALAGALGLTLPHADAMVENVIGMYTLPLGIATNFSINGREVLVPMVIEEPSVIAGASL